MNRYEEYLRKRFPKNIADTTMKYFGKSFAVEEIKDKILELFEEPKGGYIDEDGEHEYSLEDDGLNIDIKKENNVFIASIKHNDKMCNFSSFGDTNIINYTLGYYACFSASTAKDAVEGLYEKCCGLLRRKYKLFSLVTCSVVDNKYEDTPERINAVVKFEYHMKKEEPIVPDYYYTVIFGK